MSQQSDATSRKIISCNLKKLRQRSVNESGKSFTQKQCAEQIGVTQSMWGTWEAGLKLPGSVNQKRIADLFGVTLSELWAENDAPSEKPGADAPFNPALAEGLFVKYFAVQTELAQLTPAIVSGRYDAEMVEKIIDQIAETVSALRESVAAQDSGQNAG